MSRRPPSAPPVLPGFEHIRLLGSGGFADVFLFQQRLPRRQVAVKVLTDRLGTETVEGFTAEANLMAQLATHPSIVSVYQADVAGDGRPYLVMEYCSRPNLQVRHRRERFSEAETLRIGIQIAGAVETAHRAGILHRDIKPANILVTEYGRPALTDFGISATTTDTMAGMSVPWSPPESFRVPAQGDASSDVYSLAATLYTLLTGRSPFEIAGASNTEIDLIARIQAMPVPALGRAEVSASLEAVLGRALAKTPRDRYASAAEFARALQRVQIELGMQATPIDVIEDELSPRDDDDADEPTRFRGITNIDAQSGPGSTVPVASVPVAPSVGFTAAPGTAPTAAPGADATIRRAPSIPDVAAPPAPPAAPAAIASPPAAPPVGDTVRRAVEHDAGADAAPAAPQGRGRRRVIAWVVAAAVVVVVAVVGLSLVLAPRGATPESSAPAAPVDPVDDAGTPSSVEGLTGAVTGDTVVFTWTNPDPQPGDVFQWRPDVAGESAEWAETAEPTASIALGGAAGACIEVVVVRENGRADDGVRGCAP